ncbi:hypothetical protein pb186bvf_003532 [Paramecium bursaria]
MQNIVLLLYSDQELAIKLLQQIQSYYKIQSETNQIKQKIFEFNKNIVLKTKYYEADISFIGINYDNFQKEDTIDIIKTQYNNIQGVVFFVDAETLKGHNEFIELSDQLISELDPSLQVVIYNRKQDSQLNQALIEKEEQGLQTFIESVYFDLDEAVERKDTKMAQKVDDVLGFDRIIEILECNTWATDIKYQKQQVQEDLKEKVKEKENKQQKDLDYEGEDFANLLNEIMTIRQSNISHEERKIQAEKVINKLTEQYNISDSD